MQAGYENEWVGPTYEFIVSVVVWERVLVATNKASVELQSVEMDLSRAEIFCPWHWLS